MSPFTSNLAAPPPPGSSCANARPLNPEAPEVREALEALDDAMFAAMAGDAEALQRAPALWSQAVTGLGPELVDESREQYLRFAAEVTRRFQAREIRNPAAAIAALELIELLSRDA